MQERVFEVLGLTHEEIEEKFGHLLRAFRYGAPPHGGIAMGVDRLVMLLAGKDAIRDVTAFPKAQSGADPLTGGPAPVDARPARRAGDPRGHATEGGRMSDGLSAEDIALLRGENYGYLVTLNADGTPQVTVTWVDASDDGHVLINSAAGQA